MTDTVLTVAKGSVIHLVINRPEKMNAIDTSVRRLLREHIEAADRDEGIKVIVLEGAGGRSFSSGADLNEVGSRSAFERRRGVSEDAANVVRRCQKPVIAKIDGYCLGGGLELASACDIRVASSRSSFGYPEINHGWLPAGGGGTQSLPRLVGMGQAMRLVMTGQSVDAATALQIGLVDEVYGEDDFAVKADDLAQRISTKRLRALILAKAALRAAESMPLAAGLAYEREISTITYFFEDRHEAIKAFQEKREADLND